MFNQRKRSQSSGPQTDVTSSSANVFKKLKPETLIKCLNEGYESTLNQDSLIEPDKTFDS